MTERRTKKTEEALRFLIHNRLNAVQYNETMDAHPDEDALNTFMEGRLEEPGASQIVSHLIVCGACRRTTAEYSRLELPLDSETGAEQQDDESGSARSLVQGLVSRIVPSGEDAVFAYQESEISPETDEPNSRETKPSEPGPLKDSDTDK